MAEKEEKVVYYDILWNKIRTIKDMKEILKVLASKVVINHSDEEDQEVYESLKDYISKSDEQSAG